MNETWWVNISQLDDQQKVVLTTTPDSSLMIVGPPGSGKTNILMLRANYVRPVGPRQLFLTFTRALAEHLRSGPNIGRADQIQSEEISTFMGWARRTIKNNGGVISGDDDTFDQERKSTLIALEKILNDQQIGKIYDVVFVDEVQDFWERELDILGKLSYKVNFAGDSRQRIWSHREGMKTAASMADETVELVRHYRIGEKICEYADQILPPKPGQVPLLEGCNYSERLRASSVGAIMSTDRGEMFKLCVAKIKEQLRYITEEPIGVIGYSNELLDRFMDEINTDGVLLSITVRQKMKDYRPYDEDSRIRVMTVHAAKGSEFRAVHILGGEAFKAFNKELAFTAVTRAKTEVSVYHVAPLMGHMVPATGQLATDLSTLF